MSKQFEQAVEGLVEWGEEIQATASSFLGGGLRARRFTRLLIVIIFLFNVGIFFQNIQWLLMQTDAQDSTNALSPGLGHNGHAKASFVHPSAPIPKRPGIKIVNQAGIPTKVDADLIIPDRELPPVQDLYGAKTGTFFNRGSGEFSKRDPKRPNPRVFVDAQPVFVSLVSTEKIAAVRNLVGSIHHWHPELQIRLYKVGALTSRHTSEISLWSKVELVTLPDAVRFVIDSKEEFNVTEGPIYKIRTVLDHQLQAGGSGEVLQHELDAMQKELRDIKPLIMFHATHEARNIMFLLPHVYLSGWMDNVLKALKRDGSYFVQDPTIGGGCMPDAQGHAAGSEGYRDVLLPLLRCAVLEDCPSEALVIAEHGGTFHNWWGRSPEDIEDYVCHSSDTAKVGVAEQFLDGEEEGLNEEDDWQTSKFKGHKNKLAGVHAYDCRISLLHTAPDLVFESKVKTTSVIYKQAPSLRPVAAEEEEEGGEEYDPDDADAKFERQKKLRDKQNHQDAFRFADDIIHIVIAIATTTSGTQLHTPDSLPLVNILLPSLLSTIDRNSRKYRYSIYLGVDQGDAVYDTETKLKKMHKRMVTMIGDYPVDVKTFKFKVSLSTTYVYNGLFMAALEANATYFFAVHDDTEFYPTANRYWADVLTSSLADNALHNNFGVAGPLDMRQPKIITHLYVHIPTHYEIFGELWPLGLSNTEHDEWISRVYGYKNTFLHTGIQVYNTHRFTGRCKQCTMGQIALERSIQVGVDKIKSWIFNQLGQLTNGLDLTAMLQ